MVRCISIDKIERKQTKEFQLEIECPRGQDTMTLNFDFDGLDYFCKQKPTNKFLVEKNP